MSEAQVQTEKMPLEYPKIDTLFERKEDFTVDTSKLKKSVISTISEWDVTEKIDGTNIRVMFSETGEVSFGGRTSNANLHADLLMKLFKMFPSKKIEDVFGLKQVILFGEGYGPGIQKNGGLYRNDKSFILFDILVEGKWWLDTKTVNEIASKLEIDSVPYLGRMSLDKIVDLVKTPFPSKIGTAVSEGVVARPIETLFDKRGERIIIKLKTRDFTAGKR